MKTITIKNVFKNYLILGVLLLANVFYSNAQIDLRDCGYGCTTNSFSINEVFLSATDVPGTPLTNTSCEVGTTQMVYMIASIESNRNADVYLSLIHI